MSEPAKLASPERAATERPLARRRLALVLLAVTVAFTLRIHAWLLASPSALGWDEGYIGAFAWRLLGGTGLPYVDAVSHRGPVLYWMAEAAQALGGPMRWDGIRWLSLLLSLATVALCFAAGQAGRRPFAGAVAGLLFAYVTLFGLDVGEGAALNGEPAGAPLSLGAFVLAARALDPRRRGGRCGLLVAAGALSGLAAMTKQTLVVSALPLLLWALLEGRGAARRRGRWGPPLSILAGLSLAPLSIAALYVARGHGGALVYWFWTYNARVYMDPYREVSRAVAASDFLQREPLSMLALAGLLALSTAHLARTVGRAGGLRAARRSGFELAVLLEALLALAAAAAPLRFYAHYFVTALPWVGLLAGLVLERAVGLRQRAPGVIVVLLLSGLLWAASGARLRGFDREASRGEMGEAPDALCVAIQDRSAPAESLFVWGFDGDVYVTCQRRPASRFVATTMLAGIVPPFGGRPKAAYVAEGARALAVADLEQSRPAVILDMPQRLGVSIREVPELSALLDRDYCGAGQVVGRHHRPATVYVRRDSGRCSAPSLPAPPPSGR